MALLLIALASCAPRHPAALPGAQFDPVGCYDNCMQDLQAPSPGSKAQLDPKTALNTCKAACGGDSACVSACTLEYTEDAENASKYDTPEAHRQCSAMCGMPPVPPSDEPGNDSEVPS